MIGMRYPFEVNLVGDAAATLRALIPLLERKDGPLLARDHRATTSPAGGRSWSAEASVAADPVNPMRIFTRVLRRGCPHDAMISRRLRLGRQLVRPPGQDARRHARHPVRHPGHDGPGGAVRHRRQVRPPGPAGDRLRGRRRHADERHRRADHHRPLLAATGPTRGWSSRCCTTTTSTRSPGSCARWAAPRSSWSPRRCRTSRYAGFAAVLGLGARHRRPTPTSWPARGTTALAADRPSCSTCTATPTCRRSRRTPPGPDDSDLAKALIKGDTEPLGRDQGGHQDQGPGVPPAPDERREPTEPMLPSTSSTASAYTVPTDAPEADGTFAWDRTTLVLVAGHAPGRPSAPAGPTRPPAAAAVGRRAARAGGRRAATRSTSSGAWAAMVRAVRNIGRPGSSAWRSPRSTSRCGTSRRGCSGCRCTGLLGAVRDAGPGLRQRRLHHATTTHG